MITHRRRPPRRGSALLICTLAAAVLSMATIAIVRSNQRGVARIDALRSSMQGTATADGLLQRAIAIVRSDPTFKGQFQDTSVKNPVAWVDVVPQSKSTTSVQVYLYKGSKIPALSQVVSIP